MAQEPSRVDLERLRRALAEMRAATQAETGPEAGTTTVRAVAHIVQDMEVEVRTGGFTFRSDEPLGRGGTGKAPRPLQYFAAGVVT